MAFLNNLEIPVPLGIYEIYDLDEFYNNLSLLVSKNIKNNTWIFKIDNEFNGMVYIFSGFGNIFNIFIY